MIKPISINKPIRQISHSISNGLQTRMQVEAGFISNFANKFVVNSEHAVDEFASKTETMTKNSTLAGLISPINSHAKALLKKYEPQLVEKMTNEAERIHSLFDERYKRYINKYWHIQDKGFNNIHVKFTTKDPDVGSKIVFKLRDDISTQTYTSKNGVNIDSISITKFDKKVREIEFANMKNGRYQTGELTIYNLRGNYKTLISFDRKGVIKIEDCPLEPHYRFQPSIYVKSKSNGKRVYEYHNADGLILRDNKISYKADADVQGAIERLLGFTSIKK